MSTQPKVSVLILNPCEEKAGPGTYWISVQLVKINFTGGVWLCFFCSGEMSG